MTAAAGIVPRTSARGLGGVLAAAWVLLIALQVAIGPASGFALSLGDVARGLGACLGVADPLEPARQASLELRLWRALTAGGVGACLAVSGALLQGLFRNGLASPSLIGVTAGANLGATLALLALGGYGSSLALAGTFSASPYIVTGAAFVGSLAVSAFVVVVAAAGPGGTSVATLLLLGVAINTCIAGFLSAVQDLLLASEDWGTLGALQAWSFGTLDDRKPYHVALVAAGLCATIVIVPFVARELDLLASGEDDARTLGVSTTRTKVLALTASALATACAVAAAGQVGFIGLVVPHVVRLLTGPSHRSLLWLSILGGAVFVLGTDLVQVLAVGERRLRPGVLMSLIGGPFFLALLLARARKGQTW